MNIYGYTIVYVADVEQTVAFYTLAFGFTQKFISPDKDYAELETGSTTLAFASHSIAESNGVPMAKSNPTELPQAFELAFVTENIAASFAQAVAAGAEIVKEPTEKPWGQQVGYVRDIDGFLIEICTPVPTENV